MKITLTTNPSNITTATRKEYKAPHGTDSVVFCANGTTMFTGNLGEIAQIAGNRDMVYVKTLNRLRFWEKKGTTWYMNVGEIMVTHMKNGMVQLTGPKGLLKSLVPNCNTYDVISLGLSRVRLPKGTTLRLCA